MAKRTREGEGEEHQQKQQECCLMFPPEGVKCSIKFPSGLVLPLFGLHVHFFGEMDIPYHFSIDHAKAVAESLSDDCGYSVTTNTEKSQMRIEGYEPGDDFTITFGSTFGSKGMCNVEKN